MLTDNALYMGDMFDYVIVPNLDVKGSIYNSIKGKDVESEVDHLDFYYKIMELFNKFILLMVRNGIDFDHVSLSSSAGICVRKDFYDKYLVASDLEKEELMKDLFRSVYKDVVPVDFSIDMENTGYNGQSLNDMNLSEDLIQQIRDLRISGLIFYNRFLAEMRENGYSVNGLDGEINNYSDYLMNIVSSKGQGAWFSVDNDYNYNKSEDKSVVNM